MVVTGNTNNPGADAKTGMDFSFALRLCKDGKKIQRAGWNGPGQFVMIQRPDSNSANTLPYLWIHTVQGDRVPWLASQTDMLAEDWQVVE